MSETIRSRSPMLEVESTTTFPTVQNTETVLPTQAPANIATSQLIASGPAALSDIEEARSRSSLNEFQSLLEAAQRIAESAEPLESQVNDQADPIIRRATSTRSRTPLARQYRGRPHVPGEDSGSENGDHEDLFSQLYYPHSGTRDLDSLLDEQSDSHLVTRVDSGQARMEAFRARDSQNSVAEQMERDRESLRQAVAMNRELRRHQQVRRLHEEESTISQPQTEHPSSSSANDTSPATVNPPSTTSSFTNYARPHSRSNSVRRWRPAERLQDYASNHVRRSSRDDQQSSVQATTAGIPLAWRNQVVSSMSDSPTVPISRAPEHALDTLLDAHRLTQSSQSGSYSHSWDSNAELTSRTSRAIQNEHDEIVSRVERALQEYRQSRRNLRASQEESSGYPSTSRATLAELSAARASRRQTSTSFSQEASTTLSWEDRWRRDDNIRRRAAEATREHRRRYLHRLQTALDDADIEEDSVRDLLSNDAVDLSTGTDRLNRLIEKSERWKKKVDNKTAKLAKSALQYLATLREPGMDSAKLWTTAADLGLHNKTLDDPPNENLPTSVDDLPEPPWCSWLEPGVTWSGTQSADDDDNRRQTIQRARQSITTLEDEDATLLARLSTVRDRRPAHRTSGVTTRPTVEIVPHTSPPNSFARLISLDEHRTESSTIRQKIEPARVQDQWQVKATLHSVDWEEMTLTGTMTASQIRDPLDSDNPPDQNGASMDSFFSGEIIDFLNYGLDTPSTAEREVSTKLPAYRDKRQQNDWRVGGPRADLMHWVSIGPFKEELHRAIIDRRKPYDKVMKDLNLDLEETSIEGKHTSGDVCEDDETRATEADTVVDLSKTTGFTDAELTELKLDTMHRLLTNKEWLNENINKKGWILMRWKERCFVSPGTDANPEPTRPWIPTRAPTAHFSPTTGLAFPPMMLTNMGPDNRVYTTVDTEREELRSSNTVVNANAERPSQPTWGLTISGFYYVALHRVTGRIEALYYDCSSAPYQRLRMGPAVSETVHNSRDESMPGSQSESGGSDVSLLGGLRTSFNVVEFR